MAFRRQNFSSLKSTKRETFESVYKFSKKVPNFAVGSDVYVIPLGLESGYYETPCHKVNTHKVDGQVIGFGGAGFPVNIKCEGIDEEGNTISSLCCELAQKEKARCEDAADRIIGGRSYRVHLPILILGNTLVDDSKTSYPISKVGILKDLKSESGLKFSYLDLSTSTFRSEIIQAYGKKLKEEGILDYELDENSEEFFEDVRARLSKTIIKIHGVAKTGFKMAMKEYSFFPFENPTVASASGEDEKKALINYYRHKEISSKINEYLQLFNIEVDNLIKTWKEKDLLEYYNSALGLDLKTGQDQEKEEAKEVVEVVETSTNDSNSYEEEPSNLSETVSDADLDDILANPFEDEEPTQSTKPSKAESNDDLDQAVYEMEEDDDFFTE